MPFRPWKNMVYSKEAGWQFAGFCDAIHSIRAVLIRSFERYWQQTMRFEESYD